MSKEPPADVVEGNKLMHISRLNEDRLFELACIIDNEYRQYRYDRDHFIIKRSFRLIGLSTDKCDWASFINIHYDGEQNVTGIIVCGDYTEGWQPATEATMNRITEWYNNQKLKP